MGKAAQKNLTWDINGAMDDVQITLGQRDLSTILSIYTDNIGEGKLVYLFPEVIKQPSENSETDETVRTLEAFFCEPKSRNITAKFCIEGINLVLFFDSGEMLSSPIRDLNHGLCKFDITDIFTSFTIYRDRSLEGKLGVEGVLIEEIGPYINIYDKRYHLIDAILISAFFYT